MEQNKSLVFTIGQQESWKEGYVIAKFDSIGIIKAIPYSRYPNRLRATSCQIADIIILRMLGNA